MNGESSGALVARAIYALFLVAVVTGAVLGIWYRPGDAHGTSEHIRASAPFVLAGHNFATRAAIVLGAIALVYLAFKRKYDAEWKVAYLGTLFVWLAALGGQITGNALPMDQHDVRTVVVEAGIGGRVPVVGSVASKLMLGGDQFTPFTTVLWYGAHLALLLAVFVPFVLGRRFRVPYKLHWGGLAGALVLTMVAGALMPNGFPTGSAATTADYTNFDAQPSWYTLPMHAMLNLFDQMGGLGWIGAAVIPALFVGSLLFLPKLAGEHPKFPFRASVLGWMLIWGGVTLAFGGHGMAPINGDQDMFSTHPPIERDESTPIDPKLVAQGKALFKEQGCAGCHGIDGAKGTGGPDLTELYKSQPNRDWYVKFIKNPKSVKPTSTMPAYEHLEVAQLQALAEYLRGARK